MAYLIKARQQIHDQKVQAVARRLREARFFVRADLPGHPRPPKLAGIRPDIYAHKKGKKLIYEVETRGSLAKDKPQQRKLAQAAKEIGADFRVLVA